MYRIEFVHGGFMIATHVQESMTGKSLVVFVGTCDCYKSSCDCVTCFTLPKSIVMLWKKE